MDPDRSHDGVVHAPGARSFGDFTLEPAARRLLHRGQPVKLSARAFDLLTLLVGNAGRVVSAGECLQAVWPALVVEKNNLEVHVSALRKALGRDLLLTVPRRGYCFTGAARTIANGATGGDSPSEPAAAPRSAPAAADGPRQARAAPAPSTAKLIGKPMPAVLRFAELEIRVREGIVISAGRRQPLRPREMAVLAALASEAPRALSREELMARIWPGAGVGEGRLAAYIAALRRRLGVSTIATIPGGRYQFNRPPWGESEGRGVVVQSAPEADVATLPPGPPNLIGREPLLADIDERLRERGFVTLVGVAGIGKTSLALAAAHRQRQRWADGVTWVDLSACAGDLEVVRAVARALGVQLSGGLPELEQLTQALAPLQLLLVLDNCEHVLEPVRKVVAPLRAQAARVGVLATSRQRLALADELVIQVPPLSLPAAADETADDRWADERARNLAADDPAMGVPVEALAGAAAVRLLIERARSRGAQLAWTAQALRAAADVCRALDGLPLAIELAAARVPVLGVLGVRDRLREQLQLLHKPEVTAVSAAPARQASLRAAFDWSHALLSPPEQAVYRRLAVFVGGFTPALAQHVAADPALDGWRVLDHLDQLLEKSLVASNAQEPPRLRLLDTAAAHARERLAAAHEAPQVQSRHATAMRDLFDRALHRRDVGELDDYAFIESLAIELPNAAAALAHACRAGAVETAAELADGAAAVWFACGRAQEALQRLGSIEELILAPGTTTLAAARFSLRLGRCGCNGRMADVRAMKLLQQAAAGFRAHGDARRLHEALWMLAEARLDVGDVEGAGRSLAEAGALEARDWHPVYGVRRQRVQGMLHVVAGQHERALAVRADAIAAAAGQRLERWELILRCDRAKHLLLLGRHDEAARAYEHVVERTRREADRINRADALVGLAGSQACLGRPASARRHAREAAGLWQRSGLLLPRGASIAWVLLRTGDAGAAARWLGAVDRYLRALGEAPREGRFVEVLAALPASERALAMREGELMSAQQLFGLLNEPSGVRSVA